MRSVAWLVDAALRIPGTRFRVGLGALVGAPPWVGDAVLVAISLGLVAEAWRLGVPRPLLMRMLGNVAIEGALGTVPILGDLADAGFKANLRNMAIVEGHFARGGVR